MEIMRSGIKQFRQILRPAGYWGVGVGVALMLGCVSDQGSGLSGANLKDPRSADPFAVVDCLLPGQIRQLGAQVTHVTERRPIRTTAEDCAIRGGEYVALDRAQSVDECRAGWRPRCPILCRCVV